MEVLIGPDFSAYRVTISHFYLMEVVFMNALFYNCTLF